MSVRRDHKAFVENLELQEQLVHRVNKVPLALKEELVLLVSLVLQVIPVEQVIRDLQETLDQLVLRVQ